MDWLYPKALLLILPALALLVGGGRGLVFGLGRALVGRVEDHGRAQLAELAGVTALPLSGEQGVGLTEILRALVHAITEARRDNPAAFHADPQSVRELERQDGEDGPPTSRGWAP